MYVNGGLTCRVWGYSRSSSSSVLTRGFLVSFFGITSCFYGNGRRVVHGTMRSCVLDHEGVATGVVMVVVTGGCFTSLILNFLFLAIRGTRRRGLHHANNGGGRCRGGISFVGRHGEYHGTCGACTGLVTQVRRVQQAQVVTTMGLRYSLVLFSTTQTFSVYVVNIRVLVRDGRHVTRAGGAHTTIWRLLRGQQGPDDRRGRRTRGPRSGHGSTCHYTLICTVSRDL